MPGDPIPSSSPPDHRPAVARSGETLLSFLQDLRAGTGRVELPNSVVPLVTLCGGRLLALLDRVAEGLRVRSVQAVDGRGWQPGQLLKMAPAHLPDDLLDTGAGGGPWKNVLRHAGCRRALLAPLGPDPESPVLLLGRAGGRAFPVRGRAEFARLAACLALRETAGAGRGGSPESGSPTPTDARELEALLAAGGRLARCADHQAIVREVEPLLDRILDWSAFLLLHGAASPGPAIIRGGRRLDVRARQRFEKEIREAAREAGTPLGEVSWDLPAGPGDGEAGGLPAPLLVPLPRARGVSGFLAVQPPRSREPSEGQRRLLAAMGQQLALCLARSDESHRREEERLDGLLAGLPCGVLRLDAGGHLRAVNGAGKELLASMTGEEPHTGMPADGLPLPLDNLPPRQPVEFSARRDQRVYVARWSRLEESDGGGDRIIVLEDVTFQRGRRDQEMQAEKMFALGEMLSGVAHELNNPLATVVGFSQLLAKQTGEDGTRERLEIVMAEAQRARRIVQNLLDVARARPSEKAPVDLREMVEGILDLFAYQLRVDGVSVTWEPREPLAPVLGDRHQLQQILVNLVSNAHHVLRRATGERVLRVEADHTGGRVRIQVADTGPGIPETHLDRIFEPFFTTKETGVGTGLGLAIARKIATEHGGSLHARSEIGAGAVFTLDLPASGVMARISDGAQAAPAPGAGRILVVEDEQAFRQLLQESLSQEGYEVEVAADGSLAVEVLASQEFDVVISDIRMPHMDGLELYQCAMRRWPGLSRRFVFITGGPLDEAARRVVTGSGSPCLFKPFGLEDLNAALGEVLARPPGSRAASMLDSPARGIDEAETRAD
jgi:signal transduction histidine kinase/CheY-like chemotaxis protein